MGSSQDAESIDAELTAKGRDGEREWIVRWIRSIYRRCTTKHTKSVEGDNDS